MRRGLPEPPRELVDAIVTRLDTGRWRRAARGRVGLALGLTLLSAAVFGGVGYASSAVS